MARYHWIESLRADLLWYIGPPLIGLLCIPIAFAGDVRNGSSALVVITVWALALDGPHFWPTLARTVLDPSEWGRRGGVLGRSFLFFLAAPAVVLAPWLFGRSAQLGPVLLVNGFLAWAYWHTARQHWGFFRLYARKAGEEDPKEAMIDRLVFHTLLFVPPLLFVSSAWYPGRARGGMFATPFPTPGIVTPGGALDAARALLHGALLIVYIAAAVAYLAWQLVRWRSGRTLNAPKLLLLGAVAPVHLVPFIHPELPLYTQVVIGAGHAVQYQRIVWRYGRSHYLAPDSGAARAARRIFASAPLYVVPGFAFTFLLLRGPLVQRAIGSLARAATFVTRVPEPLLEATFAALFMGWLFQHYYLDARIWRIGHDDDVRRGLGV